MDQVIRYDGTRMSGEACVFKVTLRETLLLQHHDTHSPDGFEWGYNGSGPADLAVALLADVAGLEYAKRHYYAYHAEVTSKLPRDGFELPFSQVEAWVDLHAEPIFGRGMVFRVEGNIVTIDEVHHTEHGDMFKLSNQPLLVSNDTLQKLVLIGRYVLKDGNERAKRRQ